MLGVLLRAIYNHIRNIIQLLVRGGSTQLNAKDSGLGLAALSKSVWGPSKPGFCEEVHLYSKGSAGGEGCCSEKPLELG